MSRGVIDDVMSLDFRWQASATYGWSVDPAGLEPLFLHYCILAEFSSEADSSVVFDNLRVYSNFT